MKRRLLRLKEFLFQAIFLKDKYLQQSKFALIPIRTTSIWYLLITLLVVSCYQKTETTALLFEEKEDQIAVSTKDYAITFVEDEVVINLPTGQSVTAMNVETSTPILEDNKVIYKDIAKQTDLIFYDKGTGNAGYDIILEPHADPANIRIKLEDTEKVHLTENGELAILITNGEIRHSAPIAYQTIDGEKVGVESAFVLYEDAFGFQLGNYDENHELIIDPEIFVSYFNISGSTVTIVSGDPVTAGTSSTVGFQVNAVSPDDEYITQIILTAPAGWILTRNSEDASSGTGNHTVSASGSGTNAITYTITATSGTSFPGVRNGQTWGIDVDVTAPNGTSGSNNIAYTLNGDGFGDPLHTINGNVALNVDPGLDPNVVCVNVFRDYNSDGTDDGTGEPAISSAVVTAYDATNTPTVLTNNNDGSYTFTPGNADVYRIEVTGLTGNLEPSVAGSTTTFFMSRGNKVEVGLNEPAEYYPLNGVFIATPCYVEGANNGPNANQDVMVIVPESSLTGGVGNLSPTEYFVADHNQIGSTFGISYSRAANSIFAAAFTKRHTAFGPSGTGAIYKIDLNADTPTPPISSTGVSTFLDLNALFGANTAGVDPHPNGSDFDVDQLTYDAVGKRGLGGLALSETENVLWTINLEDRRLYEIPLGGTRENPSAPVSSASIDVWPASGDLTGLPGLTGTASDIRPFAVKCHKGEIYIGLVNTAESTVVFDAGTNVISNTGDRSVMRGFIYKFDPDTDTFTKLLEFPFDYVRGQAIDFCGNNAQAEFYPWAPIFDSDVMLTTVMGTTSTPGGGIIGERAYPQAWITDIEFDEQGKMLIGIRDRFADQHGYDNPPPSNLEPNVNFTADGAGDILVASINTTDNTTYVLENNSSNGVNGAPFGPTTGINKGEGPGNGEFFFDDRYRPANASADGPGACPSGSPDPNDQDPILDPGREQGHDEICTGGIFHYNGKVAVYFSAYDPINDFNNFNNAGLVSLSVSDGSRQGGNQIYATPTNPGTFAKGNGLGDVGGVSGEAPLQIGNRLWLDDNVNGRQDPNEDGINGVLVELFKETAPATFTKVAETTTAADAVQGNGFFVFSDNSDVNQTWVGGNTEVLPEMNYEVRIALAAVQAQDGTVMAFTIPNAGGDATNDNKTDLRDSDASATGVIAFTTGLVGENNHTLDIGAAAAPPCILTISSSTPDAMCSGGTYDVDFALTWVDAPTTGDFEVSIDGGTIFTTVTRTNLAASGSETITLAGVTCDGMMKSVVIRFEDDMTCLATDTYTAPADDPVCDIDIENLTTACNNNGFDYTVAFDVTWDYANATSEMIIVELNGTAVMGSGFTPGAAMGTQPFTLTMQNPAFGNTLTARFSTTTDCDTTIIFDLVPDDTCVPECTAGNLGGTVFNDFDNDGEEDIDDIGQGNILVYIYECDNEVPVDSVYTNENGDWSISGLSNYPYRVEFSTPLTPWLDPSTAGTDNGTDIQFADAASCEVDFGVINPDDYCQTEPTIAFSCFTPGSRASNPEPSVGTIPFTATMANQISADVSGSTYGSLYGMAYDKSKQALYTSAFLKRHVGIPPDGLGAIYQTDYSSGSPTTSLLTTIANTGTIDRSGANALPASSSTPSNDPDAFAKVGKVGLGDIDISADGNTLYTINLNTRNLVIISDAMTSPSSTEVAIASAPNCNNGLFRSLGVKVYAGKVYVGGVCTGENGGTAADISGSIHAYDPSDGTWVQVLEFDLTTPEYNHGNVVGNANPALAQCTEWETWADTYSERNDVPNSGAGEPATTAGVGYGPTGNFEIVGGGPTGDEFRCRAQAMISDIEFTRDGYMMIALMDRTGHQLAYRQNPPNGLSDSYDGNVISANNAGDMLIAFKNNGNWELESNASLSSGRSSAGVNNNQGPDGGEFFYLNQRAGHEDADAGGVVHIPSTDVLIGAVLDPNTSTFTFGGGLIYYDVTDGTTTRSDFTIIDPTLNATGIGKANGIGDLEAFCDQVPIQVGNYVWNDTDQDGVQDACEDPISDLIVKLYDDAGLLIGQDTTDLAGEYYFDITNVDTTGITVDGAGQSTPNTGFVGFNGGEKYFIVFMGDSYDDTNDQITANGTMYELTIADNGEGSNPDQNDSDVSEMIVPGGIGDMPVIMFIADSTDHTLDAGLIEPEPILGAIGNYVWLDENSDGLQDAGEPGIPNVKVVLKDDMGNPIDSTLTGSDGKYLFPDLPEAMYFVDVDETTLPDTDGNAMTQDLTQTTIFTNVVDGSDADMDNDDGDFGNKDHAGMGYKITLDAGEENLTADFGYNYNPTDDVNNPMGSPVGAIGDRVWYDADQDGVQDPNEAGVEGVTVKLIAASTVTIGMTTYNAGDQIATDVTDANGNYLFDGLPAGAYTVMVVEMGSPIDGYEQTGDPDHFATSEADNPDDTVEDDGMTTKPVVLGPGDVFLNVDFGYDNDADLGSIGDFVWLDADADGNGPNVAGATGTTVNQGNGAQDDSGEQPIEGVTVALIKDTNGDGKWDAGEPIIASDATDANGLYYFPALAAGNGEDYLVIITDTDNVLDGLKPTYDTDGGTMEVDAYPVGQMSNMELGISSVIDLAAGMGNEVLNQDFGYTPEEQDAGEGLIGDYVWFDTDSDGVQDPEESGIEGVKMYLFDGMGNLLDSTLTDENGYYYFGGLPVDADGEDYQIIVADDNFDAGKPLEDLENTYDPDDLTMTPNAEGGVITLDTGRPIDLIQDFGFVGDDVNPLGSIGNKIFEDLNANGVRDAGEMGFNGVTVDLYRDLNSNGELDPGEPKIGSTVTANAMGDDGMYLFENLPLDSFIVDVTDVDGVLAGYWHTDGNQDPSTNVMGDTADDANGSTDGDNSKTDAFSVGIGVGGAASNNLNVDFGFYKDPAAIGNYVWEDTDGDGQQDVIEPGIEDVVVSMMVTYPDGTMITLTDTTDVNGFYEFPNLLFDEDYRIGIGEDADMMTPEGTGVNAADPAGLDPDGTMTPKFVIKIDENQAALAGFEPTLQDETTGGITDEDDSDAFSGVVAIPVQGNEDTDQFKTDAMLADANAEEVEASYDFGVTPVQVVGTIGNYVWLDENSDGLQDAGEPGIPNVKVVLKDDMGNPIDSTLTSSDGGYLFPDLPEAMYFVDVDETTLPDTDGNGATQDLTQTTIFTNVVDGSDADMDDDDGDFGNKDHAGMGYKITLDAGEENLTADFGYNYNPTDDVNDPMGSPVGAIGDRVWYDADQDGVQDPEEAGVEGVTVKLIAASTVTIGMTTYNAGDQIATDVTDANGNYLFDGLPAGAYSVMVMETGSPIDGYEQTGDPDHFATSEADNPDDTVEDDGMTTKPVVLGPGDVFLNVDFGYDNDADLGSIGDFVWLDADADGNGPNVAGATGTTVNQGNGAEDDSGEQPIEGVTVALIKDTNGDGKWDAGEPIIASDATDANGLYYFPALAAGNGEDYLVIITDTDNVLDGLKPTYDTDGGTMEVDAYPVGQMSNMELGISSVIDLTAGMGNEVLNQDFGYTPEEQDAGEGLIGDYVWFDENGDGVQGADESGIEGVKVELYDLGDDEMIGGVGANADVLVGTTCTDENGYYYFGDLPVDADGESYQVKIAESTGASGEDNFAAGAPLEGLVNTFDPNNMTTSPDDMGGAVSLTTADPIDLDQDFGYVGDDNGGAITLGSIGNQVWEDFDADGVYEPNGADAMMGTLDDETPLEGVTIDLYGDLDGNGELDPGEPKIGTTTTDVNGMYLFDNLPLDDYIVDVTDVDGVLAGYWHSTGGQDPSTNMGDDPMDNSKEDAFAVTIDNMTPDNLNVDFGYYKDPAAVGNYVWLDTDGNGLQDDGETGLNGVAVMMKITYPDGTVVNLIDTTRNDLAGNPGFYDFGNLLIDEDYNGDGMGAEPTDTISVNGNQPIFTNMNLVPTLADIDGNVSDKEDSENFNGVAAQSIQGNQRTAALDPETNENVVASYDFGVTEELELCDTGDVCSYLADFETDDMGNPLVAGTANVFVDQPYADLYGPGSGLTFSTNDQTNHPINLYNTDGTGGNDPDLEKNSAGTGQWADGNIITEMLGNVLIINSDANIANPNDYANGGQLIVDSDRPLSRFAFDMVDLDFPLQGDVTYENTFTGQSVTIPFEDFEDGSGSTYEVQGVRFGDRSANRVISVTADKLGMLSFNKITFDLATDSGAIGVICVTLNQKELGAIGNYVWIDENSDGLQDAGEPGIPNVAVILKDGNGVPLDTTYTDSEGKYLFPDLPAGDYNVDIDETTLPDGVTQTTTFTNVVDSDDDDVVNDDGDLGNKDHSSNGYPITLDSGEENLTADFGYNYNPTDDVNNPMGSPVAALGDRIWIDSDGDGVQDPNEVGVSGVEVTLTTPGTDGILGTADDMMLMDTTDENGNYLFDNLSPGAYSVEVTDDDDASHDILNDTNYDQTGDPDHFGTSEGDNPDDTVEDNDKTDDPIVLGPGDVYLNVDFGYQPEDATPLGSIGNTVWLDADADGNGPTDADPIGSDGDNGTGTDVPNTGDDTIEEGIAGVTVSLIQDTNGNGIWEAGEPIIATDVTDENGNYLFEDLPLDDDGGDGDADYIVWVNDTDNVLDGLKPTFDEDGGAGTAATGLNDDTDMVGGMSSVALSAGTPDNRDQDFGYTPEEQDVGEGAIGDYVWYDTNMDGVQDGDESGIEGVVVYLFDLGADEMIGGGDDILIDSTFTDENGGYLFGGLPVDADGEGYQVQIAPSNFDMGAPLEGLANTFDPDDMTTNPDNMGGVVTLDTNDPVDLDQDFGYVGDDDNGNITLGSIGNQVWEDTDADGVYEPNGADGVMGTADDETPIEGVTIDLYRDLDGNGEIDPGEPRIGTAITDANGMYLFDELPLDDYVVDVTDTDGVLAGYWHSTGGQDATTNGGDDPMDNSKEDAFAVTIDNGTPDNLNVDFGYYKEPAAVGNYVWNDTNMDGIQDGGEMGINGVVVTMMIEYPDGTMITLTDTTETVDGKMGYYQFPNLLLDEDYATGSGSAEADPSGVSTSPNTPKYTIKVITVGQDGTGEPLDGLVPTMSDANGTGLQASDAEDINGVNAVPTQGSETTDPLADETTEQDEAKYDFGFTTGLVGIGGTVWDDRGAGANENNGSQDNDEMGIGNVLVVLIDDMGNRIDSMLTNPDGTYLFEGLQPNDYQLEIPASNFAGPLAGLPFSSVPTTNTDDDDTDNDDNGIQTQASGPIISSVFTLSAGGEPMTGGEFLTPNQDGSDNSARDGNTNTTVDFGLQDVELPVELLGFKAVANKDHIDLTWSTASEYNNSHFELERSEDGKIFKQIARVEGQGTTLEQADYSYEDQEVVPGVLYYYRLKQVDFDGIFEYSEIRTAKLNAIDGGMELYPNPIGDATELQVRFYTTELTKEFVIMDIHNRSVLQVKQDLKNTAWNTMSIDIQVLPAGTYILIDKQGNSKRFVKVRE